MAQGTGRKWATQPMRSAPPPEVMTPTVTPCARRPAGPLRKQLLGPVHTTNPTSSSPWGRPRVAPASQGDVREPPGKAFASRALCLRPGRGVRAQRLWPHVKPRPPQEGARCPARVRRGGRRTATKTSRVTPAVSAGFIMPSRVCGDRQRRSQGDCRLCVLTGRRPATPRQAPRPALRTLRGPALGLSPPLGSVPSLPRHADRQRVSVSVAGSSQKPHQPLSPEASFLTLPHFHTYYQHSMHILLKFLRHPVPQD